MSNSIYNKIPHTPILNLTGLVFGKLTVIEITHKRSSHNEVFWLCRCNCNNPKTSNLIINGANLRNGNTKCCGCTKFLRREKNKSWKGYGEIPGQYYCKIKHGALGRHLTVAVSLQYLWELFLKQNRRCAITGQILEFSKYYKDDALATASLDRIDSSKGYIEGNVQWVHKNVNMAKKSLSDVDFIKLCITVANGPMAQKLGLNQPDYEDKS